jgi:hypothetical protein
MSFAPRFLRERRLAGTDERYVGEEVKGARSRIRTPGLERMVP